VHDDDVIKPPTSRASPWCHLRETRHHKRSEAIHLSARWGVDCFAALAM